MARFNRIPAHETLSLAAFRPKTTSARWMGTVASRVRNFLQCFHCELSWHVKRLNTRSRVDSSHCFAVTLFGISDAAVPFDQAIDKTIGPLKGRGFGVLTRIDVQSTLKEKIGVEFQPYVILGACNPRMAHQALQAEDKIGIMLPCNVIVQSKGGQTEVAAVDPVASMQAIENVSLAGIASKVRDELKAVVQSL